MEVARVIAQLRANAGLAVEIVRQLARDVPDPTRSPASRALDDALLTPPSAIGGAARARLGVLLDRVLQRRSA